MTYLDLFLQDVWIKCTKCGKKMLIEEVKTTHTPQYAIYVCVSCETKVQVFTK